MSIILHYYKINQRVISQVNIGTRRFQDNFMEMGESNFCIFLFYLLFFFYIIIWIMGFKPPPPINPCGYTTDYN